MAENQAPSDRGIKLSGRKPPKPRPKDYRADALAATRSAHLREGKFDAAVRITLAEVTRMFDDPEALRSVFLRWRQGYAMPEGISFRQVRNGIGPAWEITRVRRVLGLFPVTDRRRVDADGRLLPS